MFIFNILQMAAFAYVLMGLLLVVHMMLTTKLQVHTWMEVFILMYLVAVWPKWYNWDKP
jgi:hypothetical protein